MEVPLKEDSLKTGHLGKVAAGSAKQHEPEESGTGLPRHRQASSLALAVLGLLVLIVLIALATTVGPIAQLSPSSQVMMAGLGLLAGGFVWAVCVSIVNNRSVRDEKDAFGQLSRRVHRLRSEAERSAEPPSQEDVRKLRDELVRLNRQAAPGPDERATGDTSRVTPRG